MFRRIFICMAALIGLSGCTVHPPGEKQERQAALAAGHGYEKPFEERRVQPLPGDPTRDELIQYAFASSADLEQTYWQWRSAIEQIPIDGTQATNLVLSFSTATNNGNFSADRTVIGAGNDPMADIVLPSKLSAAAQRALEDARAAGRRFRKSQFELRRKVLAAYDDYALSGEMIRLDERDIQLLQATADATAARSRAAVSSQQDVLRARNELDLAENDLENQRARLVIQLAALNAILNRPPDAVIAPPAALPATRPVTVSDQELLERAANSNPELTALADEIRGKRQGVYLARLQNYPDFSLSASTDLRGIMQTLLGSVTIPALRHEAIAAAISQAQDNVRAAEAIRRQTGNDLAAQIVDDVATLRDADRQIALLNQTILPRARQAVELLRTAYQSATGSFLDVLEAQRTLIDLEKLSANLAITRDQRLLEIEAIVAVPTAAWPAGSPSRP